MDAMTPEELTAEVIALKESLQQLMERDRGQIVLCAMDAAPDGCVPCDGTLYDLNVAANARLRALFQKIGNRYGGNGVNTFAVPELRGEFVRVWDGGTAAIRARGTDAGRALGSHQDHATAMPHNAFNNDTHPGHDHPLTGSGAHTHGVPGDITDRSDWKYPAARTALNPQVTLTLSGGDHSHTVGSHGEHSHVISGGDPETRPRNVALAAFIRY